MVKSRVIANLIFHINSVYLFHLIIKAYPRLRCSLHKINYEKAFSIFLSNTQITLFQQRLILKDGVHHPHLIVLFALDKKFMFSKAAIHGSTIPSFFLLPQHFHLCNMQRMQKFLDLSVLL